MPTIQPEHLVLKLIGVGQIAVMPENDTEGRVHVKRLGLGKVRGRTGRWIAHMADTPVTGERSHIACAENITHQPRALLQVKGIAFSRCYSSRVLAAMLKHHQAIVEQLVDRRCCHHTENPAHSFSLPS